MKPLAGIFLSKKYSGFITFLLFFSSPAFSQEVGFSSTDSSRSYHIITLKDGTVLKGDLLEKNKREIRFRDEMIGPVIFRTKDVSSMEQVDPQGYYLITMMNGSVFQGKIVNRTEKDIILETANIGRVNLEASKIKTIKVITPGNMKDGKYWFITHVDAHYLVAPSAIALRPGEAYLQNTMGLFNSFNVGITKNFSCLGGIVIPIAAFVAPTLNYKLRKGVHVGAGLLFADITGSPYAGGAFGQLTFGNRNSHLSIGGAYGALEGIKKYYYSHQITRVELGLLYLGASKRLSPKYALVTENWFTPNEGVRLFTGGVRLLGEKNTWDFGIGKISIERSVTGSNISLGTISFLSYMRNL